MKDNHACNIQRQIPGMLTVLVFGLIPGQFEILKPAQIKKRKKSFQWKTTNNSQWTVSLSYRSVIEYRDEITISLQISTNI